MLYQTKMGKELWDKYAKNKDHDIYIAVTKNMREDALGETVNIFSNSSSVTKAKGNKIVFEFPEILSDAIPGLDVMNGVTVKDTKRKMSIILLNGNYLDIGAFGIAEALFHELKAHVESKETDPYAIAYEEHEKYGWNMTIDEE
jgi:hypothetical protein